MKRYFAFMLVIAVLTLAACGKAPAAPDGSDGSDGSMLEYSVSGEVLKVTVSNVELDYTAAPWVGLCPVGEYVDEPTADNVDATYAYFEEGSLTAEIDISGIEKGKWTLVLCDTDDGEDGKVLASVDIELK